MEKVETKTLQVQELDKAQLTMGKEIEEAVSDKYDGMFVNVAYIGLSTTGNRAFEIRIGKSGSYDYKIFSLNYLENLSSAEYVDAIECALVNGNYKQHVSTPEESYLHGLINDTKCKGLYIIDGILYSKDFSFGDTVDLNSIEEMHYNKVAAEITFIEDSGEKVEVNLASGVITWIEEEKEIARI